MKRGRPRSLKPGHRVVAVSLDPSDLYWIDETVTNLRSSGVVGEGPTRSSIIRLAVSRVVEESRNLPLEILMARFGVGSIHTPEPQREKR